MFMPWELTSVDSIITPSHENKTDWPNSNANVHNKCGDQNVYSIFNTDCNAREGESKCFDKLKHLVRIHSDSERLAKHTNKQVRSQPLALRHTSKHKGGVWIPGPMGRAVEHPARHNAVGACLAGVCIVDVASRSSSLVPYKPAIRKPVQPVVWPVVLSVGGVVVVAGVAPENLFSFFIWFLVF